ncbi:hypothetical protein DFP73DRAFT_546657, partial [Morchella snyderi]
ILDKFASALANLSSICGTGFTHLWGSPTRLNVPLPRHFFSRTYGYIHDTCMGFYLGLMPAVVLANAMCTGH